MIITVTCSPAVDYIVDLDSFREGEINRAIKEKILPGGKGINVSRVLNNFGIPSVATGFLGGFTGNFILDYLHNEGINTDFVRVEGITRVNWKIASPSETAIDGVGPVYQEQDIEELFEKLLRYKEGDIVCFCGKYPKTMTDDQYLHLLASLKLRGIRFIVDTYGKRLLQALKHGPFLVKPNIEELEETLGRRIQTEDEMRAAAQEFITAGAENVIVSLGADGLYYRNNSGEDYRIEAPKGVLVNSVGAGDSTVAGYLYGMIKGWPNEECARFACCAGSASAFSDELATLESAMALFHDR